MCDTVAGELIVSASRDDGAAEQALGSLRDLLGRLNEEDPVTDPSYRIDSLDETLHRLGLDIYPKSAYWRVLVPPRHEEAVIERLYAWHRWYSYEREHKPEQVTPPSPATPLVDYDDRPDAFIVTRSAQFGGLGSGGGGASSSLIRMEPGTHQTFLRMVGCDQPPTDDLSQVVVAILDTGIDGDTRRELRALGHVLDEVDVVTLDEPGEPSHGGPSPQARDEHGHGSAVARIIAGAAPGCRLVIVRILDRRKKGSEWELVTGLHAAKSFNAHILNLSMGTELLGRAVCPYCGRQGRNVRARALQRTLLDFHSDTPTAPLVVAANGNSGEDDLVFPARFPEVIAIAALTSTGEQSTFTNYGSVAWPTGTHDRLFSAPGGQAPVTLRTAEDVTEWVANYTPRDERFYGTSAACAYATGVAARFAAAQQTAAQPTEPTELARLMEQRASGNPHNHSGYGHGLVWAP